MITDPTLLRIGAAAQLHHLQGRRAEARDELAAIWAEIGGERGDPLHVCVLAHTMADVQDDVRAELLWDERALAAADLLSDAATAGAGVALPVAGLYPSLHLNLADCHRRLGDLDRGREQHEQAGEHLDRGPELHEQAREHLDRAREHLEQARAAIGALGDDDYGRLIRDGLDRLTRLLAADRAVRTASAVAASAATRRLAS